MNKLKVIGWCLVAIWGISTALAAPAVIWVRGADGKWRESQGEQGQNQVTVKLGIDAIGAGQARVLVDKPEWMVLEDEQPPQVVWLRVNDREVKLSPEGDLGMIGEEGASLKLTLGLQDNANPLQAETVEINLQPRGVKTQVDVSKLGFPQTDGELTVSWTDLKSGIYRGTVRVADSSPQANVVEIPLQFTVAGVTVSDNRQEVKIVGPGGEFVLQAKKLGDLRFGDGKVAYLTNNANGEHMYIDEITEVEVERGEGGEITVKVQAKPGETDKGSDGAELVRLEYDLTLKPGLPGLLVTSRTVNLGPQRPLYCWWGWLPGSSYQTLEGVKEWSGRYETIGKVGWVYLEPATAGQSGIGWISPQVFGESRFSTMLLYTDPQKMPRETNEASELRFLLMTTNSAEAVAEAARQVEDMGIW